MATDTLTPKQARFYELWQSKDSPAFGNATEAYRRTYNVSKMDEGAIGRAAHELTRNPKIAGKLKLVEQSVAQSVTFDKVDAFRDLVRLHQADATKIMHTRRICCRHCHGITHAYQWRDAVEYWEAVGEVLQTNAMRAKQRARLEAKGHSAEDVLPDDPLPTDEGGYGWRRPNKPHPDCPQCFGEGEADVFVADMTELPEAERKLVAAVKRGKDGSIEVKMRDQDGALNTIVQVLKMIVNKSELSGPDGGPIPLAGVLAVLPVDENQAAQAYQRMMEGGK